MISQLEQRLSHCQNSALQRRWESRRRVFRHLSHLSLVLLGFSSSKKIRVIAPMVLHGWPILIIIFSFTFSIHMLIASRCVRTLLRVWLFNALVTFHGPRRGRIFGLCCIILIAATLSCSRCMLSHSSLSYIILQHPCLKVGLSWYLVLSWSHCRHERRFVHHWHTTFTLQCRLLVWILWWNRRRRLVTVLQADSDIIVACSKVTTTKNCTRLFLETAIATTHTHLILNLLQLRYSWAWLLMVCDTLMIRGLIDMRNILLIANL